MLKDILQSVIDLSVLIAASLIMAITTVITFVLAGFVGRWLG